MSRIVFLEQAYHAALCLDPVPRPGASILVPVGRSEIPFAIADVPLFLAKDASTGVFEIAALMGLVGQQNLFWRGGRWQATYLPEALLSGPFRLAAESPTGLAIDGDDPRLGSVGEALFTPEGDASSVLKRECERLTATVADIADGRKTAAALVGRELIRPVTITLRRTDGASDVIEGLYAPSPDALASLTDEDVVSLYMSGDLAAAVLIAASACQLDRLQQLHNSIATDGISDVVTTLA
jgi:hypothetical protein